MYIVINDGYPFDDGYFPGEGELPLNSIETFIVQALDIIHHEHHVPSMSYEDRLEIARKAIRVYWN